MELSNYYLTLEEAHRDRYMSKISTIEADPYLIELEDCSTEIESFPKVFYPDLFNYLVYAKSAYTCEQMKAYKSLEAYNQAACGWVKKICVKTFGCYVLVLGKVLHSQRLREKLLLPWIIAKKDGEIVSAHCDCVAGLGESCTHVAAVLFCIEEAVRKLEQVSCTGKKAYWMPPTKKPADPSRVVDLDFATAKKKKLGHDQPLRCRDKERTVVPPMTEDEKFDLLRNLANTSQGSVLHTVTRPFSEQIYAEIENKKKFTIMVHYKEEHENKTLRELQEIGLSANLSVPIPDCRNIEKETRLQSKSRAWFLYRAGRVTASKFKSCCRTSVDKPSMSVIKSICYPSQYKLKVKALEYGCEHEVQAVTDFIKKMQETHENFGADKMGLFINSNYPYFGASPDAVVECDCCGMGLLEVKCPYCARHSGVIELMEEKKNFFLKFKDGEVTVSEDHAYYYQVQMQLALTRVDYCYLLGWSKENCAFTKIQFNSVFWERESEKAKNLFFKVLFPEVLGKFFTKTETKADEAEVERQDNDWEDARCPVELYNEVVPTTSEDERNGAAELLQADPNKVLYCVCRQEDDKKTPMIGCDSGFCKIEWYHLSCLGLKTTPDSNPWICKFCK